MGDSAKHDADRDGASRCVMAVRRMMKETVDTELVLNPALDMMFAIYLARQGEEPITKAQICAETGVAVEICHRWGWALQQRGLIVEEPGGYRLTAEGRQVMSRINDSIWALVAEHMDASRSFAATA